MRTFNFARFTTTLLAAAGLLHASGTLAVTCNLPVTPSTPDSQFTVHGNGTVTHATTGLMWKVCSEGQTWSAGTCTGYGFDYDYDSSMVVAESHTFAGHSDWRMPSMEELQSVIERCRESPGPRMNDAIFPSISSPHFWSGSLNANFSSAASFVNFYDGDSGSDNRSVRKQARFVRGAQSHAATGFLPNGVCGSAADAAALVAPTAALCAAGTPSTVDTSTRYFNWSCAGEVGFVGGRTGATVICTAPFGHTVTAAPNPASGGGVLNCAPTAGGAAGATATVISGATATCTATPDLGYSTANISSADCGASPTPTTSAGINVYTTAAVTANCSVTAAFTLNTYTVSGAASPAAGGSVSCTSPVSYGATSSCTPTATAGYTFASWSGDCAGSGVCEISNITANKTVTAAFTLNTYTVSGAASPVAGGSVSCTSPVSYGATSSCTPTATAGYTFASWGGDCAGSGVCEITNITTHKSVTANFAPTNTGRCGAANNVATINPPTTGICAEGTASPISAVSGNYNWTCAGSVAAISTDDAMCSSGQQFTVSGTAAPAAGGSVSCASPVNAGADSTCTPTATAGYTFANWSGDCTGTGTCSIANISANKAVTANFAPTVTGRCGAANGVATRNPPTSGICAEGIAGSISAVLGNYNWLCAGSVPAITMDDANCSAPITVVATPLGNITLNGQPFTGTTLPPTPVSGGAAAGQGSASFTTVNGGANCGFDAASTGFVAPLAALASTQPQGMFRFRMANCTAGFTARVTVTWPASLAATNYVKYGRAAQTPLAADGVYVPQNLVISGNSASFDVTDGGWGDNDLVQNGEIVDPSGPIRAAAEAVATPVPTLNAWMLWVLAGVMGVAVRVATLRKQ